AWHSPLPWPADREGWHRAGAGRVRGAHPSGPRGAGGVAGRASRRAARTAGRAAGTSPGAVAAWSPFHQPPHGVSGSALAPWGAWSLRSASRPLLFSLVAAMARLGRA